MSLRSAVAIIASGSVPRMKAASTAASVRRGVRLDVWLVEAVQPGRVSVSKGVVPPNERSHWLLRPRGPGFGGSDGDEGQ